MKVKGGNETATFCFELTGAPQTWSRRLILRLYPEYRAPEDAAWESSVQNALANAGYPVASTYAVCTDRSILGGAFFIMECLPGETLWKAPVEAIPVLLGKSHAALHRIDPGFLLGLLREQGFDENRYIFGKLYDRLPGLAEEHPWMREIVAWLIENRPPEPEHLVICHNDFHPGNILVRDGEVTGVLDWHLSIADPALDIANTIKLITVHCKNSPGSEVVDWDLFLRSYLAAYQAQVSLGIPNVDYFRVLRSLADLYDGFMGNQHLRQPCFRKDLVAFIHEATGIWVQLPEIMI
ncbi:MAG: phosphotransferase family protein [Chloroflexota bacterium]